MKKESEQHPREEEETVERRKKERVCVCVCEREGEGEGERERMRSSECSNHPVYGRRLMLKDSGASRRTKKKPFVGSKKLLPF